MANFLNPTTRILRQASGLIALPLAAVLLGGNITHANAPQNTVYLPLIQTKPESDQLKTFVIDINPKFNRDAGYPAKWTCSVLINGQDMSEDPSLEADMALYEPHPELGYDLQLAYASGLELRHEFAFTDLAGARYVDCNVKAIRFGQRWYTATSRFSFLLVNRGIQSTGTHANEPLTQFSEIPNPEQAQ